MSMQDIQVIELSRIINLSPELQDRLAKDLSSETIDDLIKDIHQQESDEILELRENLESSQDEVEDVKAQLEQLKDDLEDEEKERELLEKREDKLKEALDCVWDDLSSILTGDDGVNDRHDEWMMAARGPTVHGIMTNLRETLRPICDPPPPEGLEKLRR
jgi:chromosome segregation ATPase